MAGSFFSNGWLFFLEWLALFFSNAYHAKAAADACAQYLMDASFRVYSLLSAEPLSGCAL